jgi:hypothetical protein
MKRLILSIFLLLTFAFAGAIDASANSFMITTTFGDHGYIQPALSPPGQSFPAGATFDLYAYPDVGYTVEQILVDGVPTAFDTTVSPIYSIASVDKDYTIHVTFKLDVPLYEIEAIAGPNGKIDPSGKKQYMEGEEPCYTITPDPDYEIEDLKVDGVSIVPLVNPYCFEALTADHSIEVSFKVIPDTFDLTITVAHYDNEDNPTSGTSTTNPPPGVNKVLENATLNVTFSVESSDWIVDSVIADNILITPTPTNYDGFPPFTENHTLHVAFRKTTSIPTIEIPSLSISPNPANGVTTIIKDADVNFTRIDVVDIEGNVVLNIENPTNTINFANLANGSYIVRFHTKKGFATRSIVKN